MNKETQSIVTTMLGGLLISITLSGIFTSYVKPGFRPVLLTAGVILVVVGILNLLMTIRDDVRAAKAAEHAKQSEKKTHGHDSHGHDTHGHDHSKSKAPWLIMAPVLVLLLVAPPALGADSVERSTVCLNNGGDGLVHPSRRTDPSPPLPDGSPPQLTMADFISRALYDSSYSVVDEDVRVTVFVVPSSCKEGGYDLVRLRISCCAADAFAQRVHVDGDSPVPANTWVNATVRAVKDTGDEGNNYIPSATVVALETIPAPDEPYES
ncbi:TIGR03943 family protein [Nakamurella antarctica]|uniref:TIGR03943 family protein n=1 Tax=Nakamurella antarctica TaxID=1902245 RepID=A0A3G8ZW86_9ACTN|nr:TIGR03943 family protein [Nakamurella antarctica]AZI58276.1 TIGR03943 family protein [Nakamurella antarctica]